MDVSQFKQTFLPCHARLYTAAWRLTGSQQEAEDLVQDTLLKLWTKRDDLTVPDNAEAFAVTTLRNLYYDQQRKKHLRINDEEPKDYQWQSDRDASDQMERQQEMTMLQQAIHDLPEKQRMIISLHDLDDLSYEEIEAQTGLTAINIRVALSRARKTVRERLRATIHPSTPSQDHQL